MSKKKRKKKINYANRGKRFEKRIEEMNAYYLHKNIAVIHKKPTPMRIVNQKGGILTAVFSEASTTDFNGIYKGRYIDFDAKQTSIKTSFPLKNVGRHQYRHLLSIRNHGGVAFLLVRFSKLEEVYVLPIEILSRYWEEALKGGRKSIPYDTFKEGCISVKDYDYLEAVEQYIAKYDYFKEF